VTDWFYKVMGEEFGPLSAAELKLRATQGEVGHEYLVRKGTEGRWVPAWRVKGLFRQSVPEPPPAQAIPTSEPTVPVVKEPDSPPVTVRAPTSRRKCDNGPPPPIQPESGSYHRTPSPPTQARLPRRRRLGWFVAAAVPVVLLLAYSWSRNNGLRDKVKNCPSYGVVYADA